MLIESYATQDAIPEQLREHYKQVGDKWVLDGFVPRGLLEEHRNSSSALARERDEARRKAEEVARKAQELEARYQGVDPDEHKKLLEEKARKQEKKLIEMEEGDFKRALDEGVKARTQALEGQVAQIIKERDEAKKRADKETLESLITKTALDRGVHKKALTDVILRAERLWGVEDGEPVAKKGEEYLYSMKEPTKRMGIAEWLEGELKDAPHWLAPSSGGGARGGSGGIPNGVREITDPDAATFGKMAAEIAAGKVIVRYSNQ